MNYHELEMCIPLEPPTGNHYVKHTRAGRHYITARAKAWLEAVAVISRGIHVTGKSHDITYVVYQGFKSKGDVDNYAKCILDGLVKSGVLKSDASVVSLHAHKRRDRENPRTEIYIRQAEKEI